MNKFKLAFFIIVVLVIAFFSWQPIVAYATLDNVQVVINKDPERVSDRYLIFTIDENGETEVFENVDSFWHWKWDSSDIYAKIQKGDTCEMTVYGFRYPIFSSYRNIVSVECESP